MIKSIRFVSLSLPGAAKPVYVCNGPYGADWRDMDDFDNEERRVRLVKESKNDKDGF